VDGNEVFYRGYHAMLAANFKRKVDEPTGSLYLFTASLIKLLRDLPSSHFAVMFDEANASTQRKQEFPAYKESRPHCSEELIEQLVRARDACDALGVPWRSQRGFEADDLIATYTWEASKDSTVQIVSRDKDLLQLVGPKVQMYDQNRFTNADRVKRLWGVRPDQIGDLLALSGDSSDCIPGVPGIGPKKAAAMLMTHQDIKGIFEAVAEGSLAVPGIGPKLTASLIGHEEQVWRMRQLIALRTVPTLDAPAFRKEFMRAPRTRENLECAVDFCEQQGFKSLTSRLLHDYAKHEIRASPTADMDHSEVGPPEHQDQDAQDRTAKTEPAVFDSATGEKRLYGSEDAAQTESPAQTVQAAQMCR